METMNFIRISKHKHSFVERKHRVNVLMLFALREILKYERFFSTLSGKKSQKRVSQGKKVKMATHLKSLKLTKILTIMFHKQILTWLLESLSYLSATTI